jgi:hypothetical protein
MDQETSSAERLVRTYFGEAPRCQATCKRTGKQCGRPARRGFSCCTVHGAGSRRRELAGLRTNPKIGRLSHGLRARPATLVALAEIDAVFAAARAEVASQPQRLRDVDAVLADLWGLRRVLLQQVQFRVDEQGVEQPPAVLGVLHELGTTIERAVRIEQRLSHPEHIHVSLMRAIVNNTVAVLEQYVAPEHLGEALDEVRKLHAALLAPREPPADLQHAPTR